MNIDKHMNLKLLTLNLYDGGMLFNAVLDFLKRENPDIFLLQEVNNGHDAQLPKHLRSIEVLIDAFPQYKSFFAPEILLRYPEGKIDIGNAIFSKYPIENEKTIFLNVPYGEYDPVPIGNDFSQHPKNMQICDIKVGDEVCTVGNLHGLWELSGTDTPERLNMSTLILQELANKENVILAGDFNVKPDTQTIKNIEHHFVNIFKNQLKSTFNLKRKNLEKFPGYASAAVDMVFTSPSIRVLSQSCPDVDVSDHRPLVIEFAIG